MKQSITDLRRKYDETCLSLNHKDSRIRELEREIERLTKSLENSAQMVDSRSREEGRLDGYRKRVREEDAKSLGKMWHEANDPNQSAIPWGVR